MKTDSVRNIPVTVGRYYFPTDAHIAAGRLRSEGIPVLMPEINHVTANWLLATALGGIRLQVPARFADHARQALSESDEFRLSDHTICPNCASSNLLTRSSSWNLAFLAIHFLSIPLPWRNNSLSCLDCHTEFSRQDDA